ncbi:MAG: hypothetical protein ACTSWD_02510, partial [Candidatus Heimdallarchaeota archaeon]
MQLKDKLNTLKKKYDQEKNKVILEDFISKSMPIAPKRVYISELFERIGSVKYGDDFQNNGIDLATLITLLKELPAEPMYLVKDGCTSFRATKDQSERAENIEVNPITIKIKSFQETSLEINWSYKLDDGQIIEVKAIITDHNIISKIAHVSYDKIEFRGG